MTPELLSQIVTVMAGFVVFAFAGKVIEIAYTVIKKLAPIVFAAVVVIVAATAIIDPMLWADTYTLLTLQADTYLP